MINFDTPHFDDKFSRPKKFYVRRRAGEQRRHDLNVESCQLAVCSPRKFGRWNEPI